MDRNHIDLAGSARIKNDGNLRWILIIETPTNNRDLYGIDTHRFHLCDLPFPQPLALKNGC